jgi:signal transduction histidine kinase
VKVLPPFWATWWFRTTSILMAAVLIALAFRAYVKHKLREQREAHAREQAVLTERMRIAGDMHDDLGAGLSALKLRSEMALRVERDPQKREQLGNLARTAGDLIGSMRQIIWTMNTDQSSLEDLVVYATSYARQYGEENGLDLKVDPEGPWPSLQLTAEQRRNIFLILKEALHNVVKHARARRVVVSFQWKDVLVLEVQDDGIGLMQGAEQGSGNGFRNMRKRAEHIGESLEVTGTNGTRIRMSVPLGTSNERSIGRT